MNWIRGLAFAGMVMACASRRRWWHKAQGQVPAPTINDRDPGVDGNAGFSLPYEFKRQAVFYRT